MPTCGMLHCSVPKRPLHALLPNNRHESILSQTVSELIKIPQKQQLTGEDDFLDHSL